MAKTTPGYHEKEDIYITGSNQVLDRLHPETKNCHEFGCVIHAPTQHTMSNFDTHWRDDRGIMERICSHGIGHPDPDTLTFVERTFGHKQANTESVHGCDGCCHGAYS